MDDGSQTPAVALKLRPSLLERTMLIVCGICLLAPVAVLAGYFALPVQSDASRHRVEPTPPPGDRTFEVGRWNGRVVLAMLRELEPGEYQKLPKSTRILTAGSLKGNAVPKDVRFQLIPGLVYHRQPRVTNTANPDIVWAYRPETWFIFRRIEVHVGYVAAFPVVVVGMLSMISRRVRRSIRWWFHWPRRRRWLPSGDCETTASTPQGSFDATGGP